MSRRGRQSSKPSRQASESPVMSPVPILRAISSRRMGPTGTSLMATCHSSAAAGAAAGMDARSEPASWPSLPTFLRKSAPSADVDGRPGAAAATASGVAAGAVALAGTRAAGAGPGAALGGTPAGAGAFLGTPPATAGVLPVVFDAAAGAGAAAFAGTLALGAADVAGTGAAAGTATGAGASASGCAGGATLGATPAPRMRMSLPHLRHVMRSVRPATFSSGIWYFALQLSQRNFIGYGCLGDARWACQRRAIRCSLMPCRVSSSGEFPSARSHISMALYLNPAR